MFNSVENSYAGGGFISGALSGASTGAGIGTLFGGPVGTAIGTGAGFLLGGAESLFREKREKTAAEEAEAEKTRLDLENKQESYDSQINADRSSAFNDTVNTPINPVEAGFAYGGLMGNNEVGEINSTNVTEFNTGGSHEANPNGGIPQGVGPNGKVNKVEQGEVAVKRGKNSKYVFSDRLIYE